MSIRESIVYKLNNNLEFPDFELSHDEIEYIVKNWVMVHTKKRCNTRVRINEIDRGAIADINIVNESMFKEF